MGTSINKVILVGNCGADPEFRVSERGIAVCKLSIGTSERFKNSSGLYVEETSWHKVTIFNKLAELCQQYLGKGSKVFIEGRIEYSSWTDDDGIKRFGSEIIAREIIFGEKLTNSLQQKQNTPDIEPKSNIELDDLPF